MSNHLNERPIDVRGILVEVADMLDVADRAFEILASIKGTTYDANEPKNREMQRDLRSLAQYFASFPEMDREVYATVFGS